MRLPATNGEAGGPLLARALEMAKGFEPTPANLERVARATSVEASREAFAQWELRQRAARKFQRASEMLFVREALEQATHEELAAWHASRFPKGAPVVDLTVGIGADLIALAERGPSRGYELEAVRAACARHNLAALGQLAEVVERDCLSEPWPEEHAWADPSRRVEGVRTLDPGCFEPDPRALAQRMAGMRLGGIKLSPMLEDAYLGSLGGAVEFASLGGECREAVVWLGQEASPGVRAVHVESGSTLEADSRPAPQGGEPGALLLEADPAAIRAHALGALCERGGYQALGASNGYLTGDQPPGPELEPWLRCWRVVESLPFDRKHVRAALRRLGGSLEAVKSRGLRLDGEAVRKELRTASDRSLTLAVFPTDRQVRAVLLEPIGENGP